MTHEFKQIIETIKQAQSLNIKGVLASVVHLEGSSYRRPGVRMLLMENGSSFGAVSGGCVEKEIFRQAQEVFQSGLPKIMTYDGRFRLGCEGILYILIEPINPSQTVFELLSTLFSDRQHFKLISYFSLKVGSTKGIGTVLLGPDKLKYSLNQDANPKEALSLQQEMPPCQRLLIFGGEHDAVILTDMTAKLGWDVEVIVAADELKSQEYFPGASKFHKVIPENLEIGPVDSQTAMVLMTHSYSKDLKYLLQLCDTVPNYLGVLGPVKRRERLLNDLLEYQPDIESTFIDRIYGPSGLDLGAESPQEIAVSILAEILSVIRNSNPTSLRNKSGAIHNS
ncbi:MAG: hypothetical protein RLZZ241_653 [Bacteroidota bacterium]|jgi:xanthine/CO dehydrogenase XdhC/CoxF family maturation factor